MLQFVLNPKNRCTQVKKIKNTVLVCELMEPGTHLILSHAEVATDWCYIFIERGRGQKLGEENGRGEIREMGLRS